MSKATSIRIFLVDGDPDGLRIVGNPLWNGQAVVVSRTQYLAVRNRAEFDQPGVYVLTATDVEEAAKPRIYVGETDNLRERLDEHVRTKGFWTRLVAFTGKDLTLNKAHFRHLEFRLVSLAKQTKTWNVENSKNPRRPNLSEVDIADAEGFLDEILVICPILGISAFDLPAKPKPGELTLYLDGPDAKGIGLDEPEGFLVREGSFARNAEVESIKPAVAALRSSLIDEGVLVAEGASLRFTQDYRFSSPSTAASVLLARSANGREEWRSADGLSLRAIQEAAVS